MLNLSTGSSDKSFVLVFVAITFLSMGMFELLVRLYVVTLPWEEAHRATRIYWSDTRRVVVGDSHIYRGFILSEGITNLGKRGTSIHVMDSVLRLYYRLHKPGQLVIEASPQLLNKKTDRRRITADGYKSRILPPVLYVLEPVISSDLVKIFADFRISGNLYELTRERSRRESDRVDRRRWDKIPDKQRLMRAERKVEQQIPEWTEGVNSMLEKYNALLTHLLGKGVDICMLRTPVSSEYLEITETDSRFRRAEREFRKLAVANNIKYVDFRDTGISWSPDMFINQDHITPEASKVFSKAVWGACFQH